MNAPAIVHPALAEAALRNAVQPILSRPESFILFGIRLLTFSFPYIDFELDWPLYGTKIRLRVDGTDFPYRPIGGWWIDSSGTPIFPGAMQVPQNLGFHTNRADGTQGCWLCFKGWRDYHNHGGHQDASWASFRHDPQFTILQLIMQLTKELNRTGVARV